MKKLTYGLILSILASILLAAPSNAIFGLSHCEKVLNSLKKIESTFSSQMETIRGTEKMLSDPNGNVDKRFVLDDSSFNLYLKILNVQPVQAITKLAFNNPQCFTRTQNIEINRRRSANVTTGEYFQVQPFSWFKPTKECTVPLQQNSPLTLNQILKKMALPIPYNCELDKQYVLTRFSNYLSILAY
jgi:hypothetical protein